MSFDQSWPTYLHDPGVNSALPCISWGSSSKSPIYGPKYRNMQFPKMGLPLKSSLLVGVSTTNHPAIGVTPMTGNLHHWCHPHQNLQPRLLCIVDQRQTNSFCDTRRHVQTWLFFEDKKYTGSIALRGSFHITVQTLQTSSLGITLCEPQCLL